jgi:hypothetical protein
MFAPDDGPFVRFFPFFALFPDAHISLNCFSLKANPKAVNFRGFGTVLLQLGCTRRASLRVNPLLRQYYWYTVSSAAPGHVHVLMVSASKFCLPLKLLWRTVAEGRVQAAPVVVELYSPRSALWLEGIGKIRPGLLAPIDTFARHSSCLATTSRIAS